MIQLDRFTLSCIHHDLTNVLYTPSLLSKLMSKLKFHIRFSFEPTGYDIVYRVKKIFLCFLFS